MSGIILSRKKAIVLYCALVDIQKRKTYRELSDEAHAEVCVRCLQKELHDDLSWELENSEWAKAYKCVEKRWDW